jgi:hypothetical protein
VNKALIVSVLIGGIWGDNLSCNFGNPAVAQMTPVVQPEIASANGIKLLDAGALPRRELKFRPVAKSKQTVMMNMAMSMDMVMGETPLPKTVIPKMLMKIDVFVDAVDPSGDIRYSFTYNGVEAIADRNVSPEVLAVTQKSLKSLVGMKGNLVISSAGQLKSQNFVFPKTIDPAMKQTLDQFTKSLDQLSLQFPSELVGVGAKWQANNSLQISGIRLNQFLTYEIVELNDREMKIRTVVSQSAPIQEFPIPGVGKEVKASIISLISKGEGTQTVRFDSLLPIEGKSSIDTDSKMSIQIDPKDPPTNMASKIKIELDINSR